MEHNNINQCPFLQINPLKHVHKSKKEWHGVVRWMKIVSIQTCSNLLNDKLVCICGAELVFASRDIDTGRRSITSRVHPGVKFAHFRVSWSF